MTLTYPIALNFTCCPTASPAICLCLSATAAPGGSWEGWPTGFMQEEKKWHVLLNVNSMSDLTGTCSTYWNRPRKGSTAWTCADFCSEIQSRSKEIHSSYCKCLKNWISSLHLGIPLIVFHCSCSTRDWGMWLGYVLPRLDHDGSCTGFSRGKPSVTIFPRIPNLTVLYYCFSNDIKSYLDLFTFFVQTRLLVYCISRWKRPSAF